MPTTLLISLKAPVILISLTVVEELTIRLLFVAVAKLESPIALSDPYRVVAPVTASVDDAVNAPVKNPVVPVIAPRFAVVEYRLLAVNAVDEAVFSIV